MTLSLTTRKQGAPMKHVFKDLALMPVLFKAWRAGQIWLEPNNSELNICMHVTGSSKLMMAGLAYKRMSERIDLIINSLVGGAIACGTIILMQYTL